jgi:hypothetical protein
MTYGKNKLVHNERLFSLVGKKKSLLEKYLALSYFVNKLLGLVTKFHACFP